MTANHDALIVGGGIVGAACALYLAQRGVRPLVLEADSEAEFILVDVPSCKGWGYSDTILRGGRK